MNRSRLATVLRIRRLQEQIARGEVSRQRATVNERTGIHVMAIELVQNAAQFAPCAATALVAHRNMLECGSRDVRQAHESVVRAHDRLGRAVNVWSDAAMRREGVERLDKRAATDAEAEAERVERAALDDLVVMRFNRTEGTIAS